MNTSGTYREHIYNVCKNTDFSDQNDATATARYLAQELLDQVRNAKIIEDVMKEKISAQLYDEIVIEAAHRMFSEWTESLPDGDFKEFVKENAEEIVQ